MGASLPPPSSTTPVRCIDCAQFTLQHPGIAGMKTPMSKHGLGRCKLMPNYTFVSPGRKHECDDFTPAKAEQAAGRAAWMRSLAQPHRITPTPTSTKGSKP